MPEVLDWRRIDPHAVIHYAVQSLRAGRTIAFPTQTGYALAASGLVPQAVRQLRPDPSGEPLTLAVRGPAEVHDWAPQMSPLARRLARCLWPGPVTLVVGGAVEQGLASRLDEDVRTRICAGDTLRLAMPGHEVLREVLRRLPGPLVLEPVAAEGARVDAGQVARQAGDRLDVILDDGPGLQSAPDTLVAVNGDAWQVVREGAVSAEQIRRQTACLVLFLCTGNTCRSPLAEALCKKRLADRLGCTVEDLPERGFVVLSAGLSAAAGGPAAADAVEVARTYGADLSAHQSRPLSPELAERADYLIGMTQGHLRGVADYFARSGAAPRLLDPAGDIADPVGRDRPVYEECGRQIWRHLEALVAEIAADERPA